jgi:hypothetical protein
MLKLRITNVRPATIPIILVCFAFSACQGTGATAAETVGTDADACEYDRVFIDTSNYDERGGAIERARRKLLQSTRVVDTGWEIVSDRGSAYWVITATAMSMEDTYSLALVLSSEIRLKNDIFLALENDNEFPYRGRLGLSYEYTMSSKTDPEALRPYVVRDTIRSWESHSELVDALCKFGGELREEGWTGIAELRLELVEEMQRVRRDREEEYQKRLEPRIE